MTRFSLKDYPTKLSKNEIYIPDEVLDSYSELMISAPSAQEIYYYVTQRYEAKKEAEAQERAGNLFGKGLFRNEDIARFRQPDQREAL